MLLYICSSVSVSPYFDHSNKHCVSCYSFLSSFFPFLSFFPVLFIFSFLSCVFSSTGSCFPWLLTSKMAGLCSFSLPHGAPAEIVLFTISKKHWFVNRSHIMTVMMLEASSIHWPSSFQGWKAPEEAIFFFPMILNNIISIHISTICTLLPEAPCSILKFGSFMCWGWS